MNEPNRRFSPLQASSPLRTGFEELSRREWRS